MSQKPDEPTDEKSEPSLELPTLKLPGLGRKKKAKQPAPAPEPAEPVVAPAPAKSPAAKAAKKPAPATKPAASPPAEPARAPAAAEPAASQAEPAEPPVESPAASTSSGLNLPALPGRVAAIVTGVIVGLFGTSLTYVALQGCSAIQGTQSCGNTGFLLLVVILALMVLVGGLFLQAWRVTDPRATSFLAVGVMCVIVLVTLLEALFSAWMFLIVPIVSAASYALSHWVTTRFIEPVEQGPTHDVR